MVFSPHADPPTGEAPLLPAAASRGDGVVAWRSSPRLDRILFCLAFLLFVGARLIYSIAPLAARAEPAEIDDAYRYLAQSSVMVECFDASCPALSALSQQMVGTADDPETAFQRLRTEIHLFTYFHPLYSLLVAGLRSTGLGPVQAYNLMSAGTGLLICAAIGFWLLSVWGPVTAGIALALLSLYSLPGQGLHFVPSNMALGLAVVSWALIVRQEKTTYRFLPVLWLAALAMHPMGVFHVLIALLMLVLTSGLPLDRPRREVLLAGVLLVLGRIAFAWLVPSFRLAGDADSYFAGEWTWGAALLAGAASVLDLVMRWGATFWSQVAAGFWAAVGVAKPPASYGRRVWGTGLSLSAVLVASLAYFHPVHGSTAAWRIWIPLAFFLTAAVGNCISLWVTAMLAWMKRITTGGPAQSASRFVRQGAVLLLLGALLARSMATFLRYSVEFYAAGIQQAATKQDYRLGGLGAAGAEAEIPPGEGVLYMDEIGLYHALVQGMLARQAVYYPLIEGTEREAIWIDGNDHLTFLEALSPTTELPNHTQGALALAAGQQLEFRGTSPWMPSTTEVLIENPGPQTTISLEYTTPAHSISRDLVLPARFTGWMRVPDSEEPMTGMAMQVESSADKVLLRGLRLAASSGTNWPWDQGMSVLYADEAESSSPIAVSLSTDRLKQDLDLRLEVVSDAYSVVLARILRDPAP